MLVSNATNVLNNRFFFWQIQNNNIILQFHEELNWDIYLKRKYGFLKKNKKIVNLFLKWAERQRFGKDKKLGARMNRESVFWTLIPPKKPQVSDRRRLPLALPWAAAEHRFVTLFGWILEKRREVVLFFVSCSRQP